MENFWLGVTGNIIANLVFWLVGGLIVWLLLQVGRRRAMFRFFGMKNLGEYVIYLSSYYIEKGTIKDRNGVPRGHEGRAIPEYEFQSIPTLNSILSPASIRNVPDILRGLIDSVWTRSLPTIRFELSPNKIQNPPSSSALCVGGPKFNAVTQYYLDTNRGFFRHYKDDKIGRWRIEINQGINVHKIIGGDFAKDEVDVGYIQRFTDIETGATIILLAGLGVNGTRAAACYLAKNWRYLDKKFAKKDFAIAFRCPDIKRDPMGYERIAILETLA